MVTTPLRIKITCGIQNQLYNRLAPTTALKKMKDSVL